MSAQYPRRVCLVNFKNHNAGQGRTVYGYGGPPPKIPVNHLGFLTTLLRSFNKFPSLIIIIIVLQ